MKTLFKSNVNGRTILLLFNATMMVYIVMLVITIPKLMVFAGGKEIIDMMPGGYDKAEVTNLMAALGEEGRDYYLTKQLPLDFIFPGLFGITYALIFMFFLRKINLHQSIFRFEALLPIIAGAADYIENICIISMIKSFPTISTSFVQFSSSVSILKASATTVYFISLIVLLIVVGINAVRQRGATGSG